MIARNLGVKGAQRVSECVRHCSCNKRTRGPMIERIPGSIRAVGIHDLGPENSSFGEHKIGRVKIKNQGPLLQQQQAKKNGPRRLETAGPRARARALG